MTGHRIRVIAATVAILTAHTAHAQDAPKAAPDAPPPAANPAPSATPAPVTTPPPAAQPAPAAQGATAPPAAGAATPPAAATAPPAADQAPDPATTTAKEPKLPEVEVIQEQPKPKPAPEPVEVVAPKPKKKPAPVVAEPVYQPAPKPKKAIASKPQPAAETVAAPAPEAVANEPVFAQPLPATQVRMSPVGGSEIPIEKVPGGVSTVSAADIGREGTVIAQDVLQQRVPGIIIGDAQGNAFQTNVQYRGFDSSPVNGQAQGLAVYQNGVRINESFGDIVNWDFLPSVAINDITVMSGNPVFGLNAIGGAISIGMKDGFNYQGAEVDTRFGSFGRKQMSVQAGKSADGIGFYAAFEGINDDGFRDFSEAEMRRGYADLGFKGDNSEFHLNYTGASNFVGVTAAVPEELLAIGRERTFSSPQTTENHVNMLSANGRVDATNTLTLSGLTYFRHFRQKHDDGNISEGEPCADNPALLCIEGETAGGVGPGTNPDGTINFNDELSYGSIDRTSQDAKGYGGAIQAVERSPLFGLGNQLLVGASYDHGRVAYTANSELGFFLPRFVVQGTGIQLNEPGDVTPRDLTTINDYYGLYFSDTLDVTSQLAVTVGGRYNYARIQLKENTGNPELADLNATNDFDRFNPAAGATYKMFPGLSVYGGYSEANRAPTAAELACSDPENPCIIESFLTADPPLKQVVSKTWEAGLRGETTLGWGGDRFEWSAGVFRTLNTDDIINAADNTAGRGFFQNAGDTLRQGFEVSAAYRTKRLFTYASYSYTDATFRDALLLPSPDNPNPAAFECPTDPGDPPDDEPVNCINVSPGDRLPGIPRHKFKAGIDYWMTPQWKLGADLVSASSQFFFGDESNLNKPLAGYTKVNLHTSYDVTDNIQVYGLIENLFDARYGIYGTFFNVDAANEAAEPDPSGIEFDPNNRRSITPAIPFAAYGGVKVKF
ncbi:MAG: TonB-dependent receptor [Hyphomicrobium sp.]